MVVMADLLGIPTPWYQPTLVLIVQRLSCATATYRHSQPIMEDLALPAKWQQAAPTL